MFQINKQNQKNQNNTTTIIKTFYWLENTHNKHKNNTNNNDRLLQMAVSPFAGFIMVLMALAGIVAGVVFSRIAAEFVLIIFRINEHLGAIREQGRAQEQSRL